MKIRQYAHQNHHRTLEVDLTDEEIDADPGLTLPAGAAPRDILLAMYLHAVRLDPEAEPTAADLERHYGATAAATAHRALTDLREAIGHMPTPYVNGAPCQLAELAGYHLEIVERLVRLGEQLGDAAAGDPFAGPAPEIPAAVAADLDARYGTDDR